MQYVLCCGRIFWRLEVEARACGHLWGSSDGFILCKKPLKSWCNPRRTKFVERKKSQKKATTLIANTWWNTHALVSTHGTHLNAELRTHPHEGLCISWPFVVYKMNIVAWHVYLTKLKNRFFWIKEFWIKEE